MLWFTELVRYSLLLWTDQGLYRKFRCVIKLRNITPKNKDLAHGIFPGESGKYWVNFNWYWTEISFRRPAIISQYIFLKDYPKPVGYVSYGQHFKDRALKEPIPGSFELYHMIIDENAQRRGIGKHATIHILQNLAKSKKAIKLMVACHPDNMEATNLYKSLGFHLFSKNYDDDPLYFVNPQAVLEIQSSLNLTEVVLKPNDRSKIWADESIQSEKEFNWDDWELGLAE